MIAKQKPFFPNREELDAMEKRVRDALSSAREDVSEGRPARCKTVELLEEIAALEEFLGALGRYRITCLDSEGRPIFNRPQ
jgi:hypothetical protein